MTRRLIFRHAALAEWLTDYAAKAGRRAFERGMLLYDRQRVWDFHSSAKGIHATVEDVHNTFFQVDIHWPERAKGTTGLPDPALISAHCSCGTDNPYCAHVTAAIIYWIVRLDQSYRSEKSNTIADSGDSHAFQMMLERMRQLAAAKKPCVQDFDQTKLEQRPDLQHRAEHIVHVVMQQTKENLANSHRT